MVLGSEETHYILRHFSRVDISTAVLKTLPLHSCNIPPVGKHLLRGNISVKEPIN